MRIAILEDDQVLRDSLTQLLGGERDTMVVGSYGSAEQALEAVESASPEVILVDIGLPGLSGIEFIQAVKQQRPDVEMMVHTVFEDKETVFAAIKAGASGYLLKGSTPREIIEALGQLMQGGAPMTPKIARRVILEFQDQNIGDQYLLSAREKDVLKGVEAGLTYKEIGDRLSISAHTVHTHIKNIYEKLQAKNRQEAFVKARRKGII